jgi:hypothetical protein
MKNIAFIVLGILLFIGNVSFGETEIESYQYLSDLYELCIFPGGHWTIWAINEDDRKPVVSLWPWPFKGLKGDTIQEMKDSYKKKGREEITKIKGSTDGYLFELEIACSEKKVEVKYFLEAREELKTCYSRLETFALWVAGKGYEWGPELGVPEEMGKISAEKLIVDSSPTYFKFFDIIGRDVAFSFSEAEEIEIKAGHWRRYPSNSEGPALIEFKIYPEGMKKGVSIEPGTKGKVRFSISFSPTGLQY